MCMKSTADMLTDDVYTNMQVATNSNSPKGKATATGEKCHIHDVP